MDDIGEIEFVGDVLAPQHDPVASLCEVHAGLSIEEGVTGDLKYRLVADR